MITEKEIRILNASTDDCEWRTIRGNKVCIGEDGTIDKGPAALKGKDVSESSEKKSGSAFQSKVDALKKSIELDTSSKNRTKFSFTVGDNQYDAVIDKSGLYGEEIIFGKKEENANRLDKTGDYEKGIGGAREVFFNVTAGVQKYIDESDPSVLYFSAETSDAGSSRASLYKKLVQTVAKNNPNYVAFQADDNVFDVSGFYVCKKDKVDDVLANFRTDQKVDRIANFSFRELLLLNGGKGSGNFGHCGSDGKRGGSKKASECGT